MYQNPRLMSIRAIAKSGLMSEHALRFLAKRGKLPIIYVGKKGLVNYDALVQQLSNLKGNINTAEGGVCDDC